MHALSNPPITWSFQNGGRAPLRRCLDLPLFMEPFHPEASLRVLGFLEMISAVLQLSRVGYSGHQSNASTEQQTEYILVLVPIKIPCHQCKTSYVDMPVAAIHLTNSLSSPRTYRAYNRSLLPLQRQRVWLAAVEMHLSPINLQMYTN